MPVKDQHLSRGIFIAVLGPDGSGKTTLVSLVLERLRESYTATWRFHWRPTLLPKLSRKSAVSATRQGVPGQGAPPPEKSAYGVVVSFIRYCYYTLDFILGYWFIINPRRKRNELIIGERWYYDVIIHPARYGYALPKWLLRFGGRFVPKPDLTVLLEADPEAIHARKPELTVSQIRDQLEKFNHLLSGLAHGRNLWTGGSLEESTENFAALIQELQPRAGYRKNSTHPEPQSWRAYPSRKTTKVWINSLSTVDNALQLYNPYSGRAQFFNSISRLAPRFFTTCKLADDTTHENLMSYSRTIKQTLEMNNAVINFTPGTPGPNSKVTAQVCLGDKIVSYVKIATSGRARSLLDTEVAALRATGEMHPERFCVPRLIQNHHSDTGTFVYVAAPADTSSKRPLTPDLIDAAFLFELCQFGRKTSSVDDVFQAMLPSHDNGKTINGYPYPQQLAKAKDILAEKLESDGIITHMSHGDYAPWNTLGLADKNLFVFDWEYFSEDAPALYDLFYRIFMPNWLVKNLPPRENLLEMHNAARGERFHDVIKATGLSESQVSSYMLLFLCRLAAQKLQTESAIPDYIDKCLHYLLVAFGHPLHRIKVLVSAYACEPLKGSEAAVGWNWVNQISRDNEVWVITRKNNRAPIEEELAVKPNLNIHFHYTDPPKWLTFWKRGERGVRSYYYLWQYAALFKAYRLHKDVGFDLGHHVTFVNDWLWSLFALMPIPFVWGPIGSHPACPRVLMPHSRARLQELIRLAIQNSARLLDPLYWCTAIRSKKTIVISRHVPAQVPLKWLLGNGYTIETAIAMDSPPRLIYKQHEDVFKILFVGRFHYIKCPYLVLDAFARAARIEPRMHLTMVGKGPENEGLRRHVADDGMTTRVTFIGWTERNNVLSIMDQSDVFLFPSAEGAGMVVLEAMAAGMPVVCLDHGGPGQMVTDAAGIKIDISSFDDMSSGLCDALLRLCHDRGLFEYKSQQAQELVRKQYSWENKRILVNTVYRRVLHMDRICEPVSRIINTIR